MFDDAGGGRVVPVYALTGGRTRAVDGSQLPVETLVTVAPSGRPVGELQAEYSETIRLAAQPVSVVEISAHLRVPVGVARVLVSDLVAAGLLEIHLPPSGGGVDGGPAPAVLERLLEGLRAR
ncbi:DUF742 domain-containing protein [Pseudonocardia sp. CA-107938]|uniref:DUF742 domain-containing protein n=1 Tax=Pseudonocardia sp. CA-107938 TaxID=3240021 RepID=UPI003D8EA3FB